MKNGALYKLLRILFAGIFILGTIAIIYIGWQTQENIKKWNVDTSLNTLVCNNGKTYSYTKYSQIKRVKDINFIQDAEFRHICFDGSDIGKADIQKMFDYIFVYDNKYFSDNKVYQWTDIKDNFYLVDLNVKNPNSVAQLSDEDLFKSAKELNKQLYSNISYSLKNTPPTIKVEYKSTFETLLLFWFILYLLRRFTYFVVRNKKLNEMRLGFREYLHFKNPLIIPFLIIGVCILVVAYLVLNNSNSTNVQETFAVNQKCHDLATKYVDDQKTKYNSDPFTHEKDYSLPYTYDTNLESYTYNQDLKTCLVQYVVFKYVNSLVSPAPSPVPENENQSVYVDDVIAGKNIGSFHYTECNSNSNYCPSLVDWSFQLKSWGLSSLGFWETVYLQTFDRLPFIRSWLGV